MDRTNVSKKSFFNLAIFCFLEMWYGAIRMVATINIKTDSKKEGAAMRVCVRGIRQLDFKTAEGEVQGTQIFFSHPSDGVMGEKTDKIFIRKGFPLPSELAPGKYLDIFCDTKGHVEHIQVVSTAAGK